jgi:hypothetical protein
MFGRMNNILFQIKICSDMINWFHISISLNHRVNLMKCYEAFSLTEIIET